MNTKQKQALRDAIERIQNPDVTLGARAGDVDYDGVTDPKERTYASVALAGGKGRKAPQNQYDAQQALTRKFGLSLEQAEKVDSVAASTHNLIQRTERVVGFLSKVIENPDYVGRPSRTTNGAVGRSL